MWLKDPVKMMLRAVEVGREDKAAMLRAPFPVQTCCTESSLEFAGMGQEVAVVHHASLCTAIQSRTSIGLKSMHLRDKNSGETRCTQCDNKHAWLTYLLPVAVALLFAGNDA